jgi:hypothetical protein
VLGAIGLFFWLAVPPRCTSFHRRSTKAGPLTQPSHSTGRRHDVLAWVDANSASFHTDRELLHPIAAVRAQGNECRRRDVLHARRYVVLGLRARPDDRAARGDRAGIEAREGQADLPRDRPAGSGSYTRLKFLMVVIVGAVCWPRASTSSGSNYWLLVGGFVGLVEIVPVIGPLIGAILVVAVGLPAVRARCRIGPALARCRAGVPELRREPASDGEIRRFIARS